VLDLPILLYGYEPPYTPLWSTDDIDYYRVSCADDTIRLRFNGDSNAYLRLTVDGETYVPSNGTADITVPNAKPTVVRVTGDKSSYVLRVD
jgi:hypothetical protein